MIAFKKYYKNSRDIRSRTIYAYSKYSKTYWKSYSTDTYEVVCLDNKWEYWPKYEWYRKMRTFQESRENDFVYYDEVCREYKIKVRGRRSRKMLPNPWDDYHIHFGGKSWKDYTKKRKQWSK